MLVRDWVGRRAVIRCVGWPAGPGSAGTGTDSGATTPGAGATTPTDPGSPQTGGTVVRGALEGLTGLVGEVARSVGRGSPGWTAVDHLVEVVDADPTGVVVRLEHRVGALPAGSTVFVPWASVRSLALEPD